MSLNEEIRAVVTPIVPVCDPDYYGGEQEGELVRRYLGYDPGNVISAETLMLTLGLNHDFALRSAMMEAVLDGLRSETDERHEVDLGLLELQKKNGKRSTLADDLRLGTINGLGVRETLLSAPGLLLDLYALYMRSHGVDIYENS